jgi:hypothetical protein
LTPLQIETGYTTIQPAKQHFNTRLHCSFTHAYANYGRYDRLSAVELNIHGSKRCSGVVSSPMIVEQILSNAQCSWERLMDSIVELLHVTASVKLKL